MKDILFYIVHSFFTLMFWGMAAEKRKIMPKVTLSVKQPLLSFSHKEFPARLQYCCKLCGVAGLHREVKPEGWCARRQVLPAQS